MRSKKVRMMRGLNVPTCIVFIHGLFDGRLKAAGVDPETGVLNSAYVNGKLNLYHKYCIDMVEGLEEDIAGMCVEAETLLMELVSFPASTKESQAVRDEARRSAILLRLVQISEETGNMETNCRNELAATGFSLRERLCVYAHGALLKPVFNRYIPQIEYDWAFNSYHANHDEMKVRVSKILKEDNHV
ncbi:MAG: hypothetical protein LUE92_01920 [Clostridiales bacterium]|nr:hypothetical protein [Clostridiales bacterium]